MKRSICQPEFWIVILLIIVSFLVRFVGLAHPNEIVFDETYYAKWANDYLQGRSFFDVHPPLGKLLIAFGISLTDYTSFGWRWVEALIGSLSVPLAYLVAKKLFPDGKTALFTGLFVLLDGLILVQTRTALLDSFLIVFSLAAYASFLYARSANTIWRGRSWLALTGIFLGCALATKWTGVAVFGTILLWYVIEYKQFRRLGILWALGSLFIVPTLIYGSSFLFDVRTTAYFDYVKKWHIDTWNFHKDLVATHPYMSRWWSWPYLARPVWYYYKDVDGAIQGILAIGNPLLWWAGGVAFIASFITLVRASRLVWYLPLLVIPTIYLIFQENGHIIQQPTIILFGELVQTYWKWPSLLILGGFLVALILRTATPLRWPFVAFLATYLPWWFIGRTQFQYYIVPGLPFLFILLAWWLNRGTQKPAIRPGVWLFLILTIIVFLFFYPLNTAIPMDPTFYRLHIWFRSWI